MSRVVVISGTKGERKIDYSALSPREISRRIGIYQKRHGSFRRFLHAYDCESSPPEDSITLVDWESLLAEQKERRQPLQKPISSSRKKQSTAQ
jgi:hypothetical protein